jgi:hypothetical protein
MKETTQKAGRLASLAILSVLILGCTSYGGSIVPDGKVTRDFAAMQMAPGLNYYYSGPDAAPNAIVGLKRQYVIEPDLWKRVTDEKTFRDQIDGMQRMAEQIGTRQYGFTITDDKGADIGVFYSLLEGRTYVKMGPGNEVIVGQPDLLLYERNEQDRMRPPLR